MGAQARWVALWLALLVTMVVARPARAHEFRPIVLELRELDGGEWRVRLEVPPAAAARLGAPLEVALPEHCREARGALGVVDCGDRGLVGVVGLRGLAGQRSDALLRVHRLDGPVESHPLRSGASTVHVGPRPHPGVAGYIGLGVTHILGGLDHLLFVVALVLLGRPRTPGAARRLAFSLTGFTLGHSVTLALAVLGQLRLPGPPVEACIALSIVVVAAAALRSPGEASEPPEHAVALPLAIAFGQLHGLGFAGALREVGLPPNGIVGALLGFNLGVELGQLLVLAALLFVAAAVSRWSRVEWAREGLVRAVGTIGMAWLFVRVASFWEMG